MFWYGLIGSLFVAAILSIIGGVLFQSLGGRFSAARFLGYLTVGLAALLLLSSPFTLAARYESSETLSGTDSGCSTHRYEATGVSPAGINLFTMSTTSEWCYDGSVITGTPLFVPDISATALFWTFDGFRSNYERGGEGQNWHSDSVQGAFSYCPPLAGCIQHLYPKIVKQQLGDGNASGPAGRNLTAGLIHAFSTYTTADLSTQPKGLKHPEHILPDLPSYIRSRPDLERITLIPGVMSRSQAVLFLESFE